MKTKLLVTAALILLVPAAPAATAADAVCGAEPNCRTLTPEETAYFLAFKEKLEGMLPRLDATAFPLQIAPGTHPTARSGFTDRGLAAEFGTERVRCHSYAGGCFPDGFGDSDLQVTYGSGGNRLQVSLQALPIPFHTPFDPNGADVQRSPGFASSLEPGRGLNQLNYGAYVGQQRTGDAGPTRLPTAAPASIAAPVAYTIQASGPEPGVKDFAGKVDLKAFRALLGVSPVPTGAGSRKNPQCAAATGKAAQLDAQIRKNWDAVAAKRARYQTFTAGAKHGTAQWSARYAGPGVSNPKAPDISWDKFFDEATAFWKELAPLHAPQQKLLHDRYAEAMAVHQACGGGKS